MCRVCVREPESYWGDKTCDLLGMFGGFRGINGRNFFKIFFSYKNCLWKSLSFLYQNFCVKSSLSKFLYLNFFIQISFAKFLNLKIHGESWLVEGVLRDQSWLMYQSPLPSYKNKNKQTSERFVISWESFTYLYNTQANKQMVKNYWSIEFISWSLKRKLRDQSWLKISPKTPRNKKTAIRFVISWGSLKRF